MISVGVKPRTNSDLAPINKFRVWAILTSVSYEERDLLTTILMNLLKERLREKR
jgi:hypothetical protein